MTADWWRAARHDPAFARRYTGGTDDRGDGAFNAVNNIVSQSIPHLHFHVVPRRRDDRLRAARIGLPHAPVVGVEDVDEEREPTAGDGEAACMPLPAPASLRASGDLELMPHQARLVAAAAAGRGFGSASRRCSLPRATAPVARR